MRSRYSYLRHYKRRLDVVREKVLGQPGAETAVADGHALSLDAAVTLALEQTTPTGGSR